MQFNNPILRKTHIDMVTYFEDSFLYWANQLKRDDLNEAQKALCVQECKFNLWQRSKLVDPVFMVTMAERSI